MISAFPELTIDWYTRWFPFSSVNSAIFGVCVFILGLKIVQLVGKSIFSGLFGG